MMDMREFQEKLEQLMELAAKQEKNLNRTSSTSHI